MAKYKTTFVTADSKICQGKGELAFAFLIPSGASTVTDIYDGVDISGDKIVRLESALQTGLPFSPAEPIPFTKGLFVDIGSNTTGLLIQWRELSGITESSP